jgi:uncharacterized protein
MGNILSRPDMKSVLAALFLFFLASWASAEPLIFAEEMVTIRLANATSHDFQVEIADTDAKREQGLMNRKHLADNRGMLFVYDTPKRIRMWMKNTHIPLDMIFLDQTLHVVSIARDTVPFSLEIIDSGQDSEYVLEVKAGTTARLRIAPGDVVHRTGAPGK